MTRRSLTPHQSEVLGRLTRASKGPDGVRMWVPLAKIGSRTGLRHLVVKGYAEHRELRGPRGGVLDEFRPVDERRSEFGSLDERRA